MAFTPTAACCKPSLALAPRASSRGSAARAQAALLYTPSTSAFCGLRAPASGAPVAPRWRRSAASTAIVCGKVRSGLRSSGSAPTATPSTRSAAARASGEAGFGRAWLDLREIHGTNWEIRGTGERGIFHRANEEGNESILLELGPNRSRRHRSQKFSTLQLSGQRCLLLYNGPIYFGAPLPHYRRPKLLTLCQQVLHCAKSHLANSLKMIS